MFKELVQIDEWHCNSVTMRIISGVVPGASRLVRLRSNYQKESGKDLSDLIIMTLVVAMLVSPAATSISALRFFTAGRDTITPGI